MSERDLMTLLIGLGVFIVLGLPIIYLVRHLMKKKRVWREFAEKNSLNLEEGRFPVASGNIQGRKIHFSHELGRTLSGEPTGQAVAEFYAWAEIKGDVPEGLVAAKKGWAESSGNVQTESDMFNKKIRADCPNEDSGKVYLTQERQEMLLELIKYDGYVHGPQDSTGAFVVINRSGYKVRLDWFEERLEILLKAATIFDS